MHWRVDLPHIVIATLQGQNPTGSGPAVFIDADWTSAFVALLALAFTIYTYVRQEQKNRTALEEQREKDRLATEQQKVKEQIAIREQSERDQAAKIELERMRRQTIQLEWFQETVKSRMGLVYDAFDKLRTLRDQMRKPDLSETEKDELIKAVRNTVLTVRNNFLNQSTLFTRPPIPR